MDLRDNQNIQGAAQGVSYGQYARTDELNQRISSRSFSDSPLEPNYAPRSVQTKHTIFPIVKNSRQCAEPTLPYPTYNSQANFTPGNSRGPTSGFTNNVDVETTLRNQTFALQHGANQSVYVPSSNSELYNVSVVSAPSVQPHAGLFVAPQFSTEIHPNLEGSNVGVDRFFNHTRTQLRDQ